MTPRPIPIPDRDAMLECARVDRHPDGHATLHMTLSGPDAARVAEELDIAIFPPYAGSQVHGAMVQHEAGLVATACAGSTDAPGPTIGNAFLTSHLNEWAGTGREDDSVLQEGGARFDAPATPSAVSIELLALVFGGWGAACFALGEWLSHSFAGH